MQDVYELFLALLNQPLVKAVSLLASLLGAAAGLLSLRRVHQVANAQLANFRADHARFLNEQRSRIEMATLNDEKIAKLVAESFGRPDAEAARREALFCLYLNLLASAHTAWQGGLVERRDFEKHMEFFFSDFKGDAAELSAVLASNYYAPAFEAECRRRLNAVGRSDR